MIKNFVKILELLGDRLEVCVSVLANFNIKHAKVCAAKISLRPIITLSVRPSVH